MTSEEQPDTGDGLVPRPDDADYDLLTFGEVAARLSEELAQERAQLAQARSAATPDTDRIDRLEKRIALLQRSAERYRAEKDTNETFRRRFGSGVRAPGTGPGPRWQ